MISSKIKATFLLLAFQVSLFSQDYDDIRRNRRWNNLDFTSGEIWAIIIGIGLLAFSAYYFLNRKESTKSTIEIVALISGVIGFICLYPLLQAAFSAAITLILIGGGAYFVYSMVNGDK